MAIVKTSIKGQIVIPQELRLKYNLKPGSSVYIGDNGNNIYLSPVPKDPINAACGILKKKKSLAKELVRERKKEDNREKKKRNR